MDDFKVMNERNSYLFFLTISHFSQILKEFQKNFDFSLFLKFREMLNRYKISTESLLKKYFKTRLSKALKYKLNFIKITII